MIFGFQNQIQVVISGLVPCEEAILAQCTNKNTQVVLRANAKTGRRQPQNIKRLMQRDMDALAAYA